MMSLRVFMTPNILNQYETRPKTPNEMKTHLVLDLIYTPEEGQVCFEGTEQQCMDFIDQQNDPSFSYKIVPNVDQDETAS